MVFMQCDYGDLVRSGAIRKLGQHWYDWAEFIGVGLVMARLRPQEAPSNVYLPSQKNSTTSSKN